MNKKFDEFGVNKNTHDLLFLDELNLSSDKAGESEKYVALMTVSNFTRLQEKRIFTKLLRFVYKNVLNISFDKIVYNKNIGQYEYLDDDMFFSFIKLSDYIVDVDFKRELMSSMRYGKCHDISLALASNVKESKVVTGYCTIGKIKCLHSVIEYNLDECIFVIDWTKNIIIEKDYYVKLTNFVEISSIDGNKIMDDFQLIVDNLDISNKMYVLFRDELIRDIERNSCLFIKTKKSFDFFEQFDIFDDTNFYRKIKK